MPLALADRQDPAAIGRPVDCPPDAGPRLDCLAGAGGDDGLRVLRPPAGQPAARRSGLVERRDEQVDRTIVNGNVAEPAAIGRRQCHRAEPAGWLAMLLGARREDRPLAQIGAEADHLEPAVGVGEQQQAPVGEPARAAFPGPVGLDSPLGAGGHLEDRDGRAPVVRLALGDEGESRAVGRPAEVVDIETRGRERDRFSRFRMAGRPAPARDRRVDQPDLGPAPTARQEGEPAAVRTPARVAVAGRVLGHPDLARAVRFDDPDRAVADEGEAPAVGRPVRIADRLLGRGQLDAGPPRSGRMNSWRAPAASWV